ncbi:hypothetical protein XENTR_v10023288 [Xenopus tropicalis]|nr:hypothetical protein XENTR_v10023288 [Xenopus tropicalis]
MAVLPTSAPLGSPTASSLWVPQLCSNCLLVVLVLGFLTGLFMVLSLSLCFILARKNSQHPKVTMPAPLPLELWASPPLSLSQTELLWVPDSRRMDFPVDFPASAPQWEEAPVPQPRVTMQDIGEFWWRSTAREV